MSGRSIGGLEDGGRLLRFQGHAVGFHQLHLRKRRPHLSAERCVTACWGLGWGDLPPSRQSGLSQRNLRRGKRMFNFSAECKLSD